MIINMETVTRQEIKVDLAAAVLTNDIVSAKIRLAIWEEMIADNGFEDVTEISEFYQVKHLIDAQYRKGAK